MSERMSDERLAEIKRLWIDEGWAHDKDITEVFDALKAEREHAHAISDELDDQFDDWQLDKKRLVDFKQAVVGWRTGWHPELDRLPPRALYELDALLEDKGHE